MRAERTDSSTGRGAGLPENQPLGSSHCTAAVTAMAGSKDKQAEPTKRPRLAPTDQAMASAPRPRRALDGAQAPGGRATGSRALGSSPGLASSPSTRKGTPFRLHFFEWDGLHSSYPCAQVQRGPSCRLRSRDSAVLGTRRGQEDAVLLELRLKLHSTLLPHMLTYARLIEDYEGELLGKRPQGSLARKARGVPTNTE